MAEPFSATAPLKSVRGTVGKPGVTFNGDEDTGLYSSGSNQLAVSVGGSDSAKFTSTGLEVKGNVNLDDGVAGFVTTLQTVTPTANRTISFPNATGTVGLVAGSTTEAALQSLQGGYYGALLFADGIGGLAVDNGIGYDVANSILSVRGGFASDGTASFFAELTVPVLKGTTDFTGRLRSFFNNTANGSAGLFGGTWFTGGTSTTTKPAFLLEPAGTVSTSWSTSGTGLGVNAPSGFAGNLLDLQVNGTSRINVLNNGAIPLTAIWPAATIYQATFSTVGWALSAGNWYFKAAAGTANADNLLGLHSQHGAQVYNALGFGGSAGSTSEVFVRSDAANTFAQRNATNAQTFRVYNTFTSTTNFERAKIEWASNILRIGTEKGSAGGTARDMELQTDSITRLALDTTGSVRVVTGLTVATLPSTPVVGMVARVTDASSPAVGSTVAGGGAAAALVWYNGANWTVLGV